MSNNLRKTIVVVTVAFLLVMLLVLERSSRVILYVNDIAIEQEEFLIYFNKNRVDFLSGRSGHRRVTGPDYFVVGEHADSFIDFTARELLADRLVWQEACAAGLEISTNAGATGFDLDVPAYTSFLKYFDAGKSNTLRYGPSGYEKEEAFWDFQHRIELALILHRKEAFSNKSSYSAGNVAGTWRFNPAGVARFRLNQRLAML